MSRLKLVALVLGVLLMAAFSGSAMAQAPGGGGGRGNRGGQGGAPFDPAQARQRMLDRLKADLGASDEEFKVLSPKIEAVSNLQRQSRGGGMMGGRRGGPGGAPGAAVADTAVAKAAQELRTTLENKDSKADEIKAKLSAFRDARDKAKEELAKAQKDLKEVLTQRQEGVMVQMGMLE